MTDSGSTTNISGGINIGDSATIGGDVVGRDKIVSTTIFTGDQQYDVHSLANPYLGLQSFTYADHAKYAGREKLIAETVAHLTAPDDPLALLFVTGASGSGKSSFVQAGVLPALVKHYAALSVKWAVFRPSRDPLAVLADALWRQLGLPQYDAAADFGDFLKTHTPPQQVNVIVIDQFEELFTQSNAQPRDALFALLTHLLPFRSTRTHIIATVRADYLPELFALRELYDIAKRGIDLRAMSVDELREAIQQPLRATYPDKDKHFQSELVDRLAKDAAEDAAYLPLLQVTLEEIWRKGTLTVGAYTNLAEAIKQRADKVLEFQDYDAAQPDQPRSPEEQAAILNLCLDLVDVSLDDEARRDVRRRRSKDELISGAPERVRLIDTLAQARLLSISTDSGEPTRVEVDLIHETLLSNWDRLQQAIAERRHELRQRVRFEQQLKEWIGQNLSDDYLLSGVRLAEARELESRDDVAQHSTDAKDFVRRSVEREEARRQKELNDTRKLAQAEAQRAESEKLRAEDQTRSAERLRRRALYLIGALGVALLLGIIAGVFGFQSNQNAVTAERNAAVAGRNAVTAQAASTLAVSNAYSAQAASTLAVANASTAQAANTLSVSEANKRATAEADAVAQRDAAQQQSQLSRSRELAAVALSQIEQDPERGLLIAIETQKTADTYEAQDAFRQLLAASRLRVVLRGHELRLSSAQFSPDGQRVVTAGCEKFGTNGCIKGAARVWDAVTGKELAVLQHEGPVYSAQFSLDGKQIVTAGCETVVDAGNNCTEGTAQVWETATGRQIAVLRGQEDWVNSAQFSPDGQQIVTASADETARVWNAATGQQLAVLRLEGYVYSAQFSPDGQQIITSDCEKGYPPIHCTEGTARMWEVATGKELAVLRGHEGGITSAQFSLDGKQIVTASDDGIARVWNVVTGQQLAVLRGHEGEVTDAQFSPDGKQIVTASFDGTARVWEAATGKELTVLRGHENAVDSAQFSPNGKQIVTAGQDYTARVWEAATGKELTVLRGHTDVVWSAQFSRDGQQIVTASSDGTARVWEETVKELVVLRGHEGGINSAQFSPDGKQIVTASADVTARVWDAATDQLLAVLRGHEREVTDAQFSPDGKQIVTASYDKTARVWEVATGQQLAVLQHEAYVYSAQFSPDGKQIVTAGCEKGDAGNNCTEGTARVWETATGKELVVLRGHEDWVNGAQFSPDGKQIVTASDDKTARVWDAATGQQLAVLQGHEGAVNSAQFSPDGKQIVTSGGDSFGSDRTARVWDAATGQQLAVLRGHEGAVNSAQFSPDGKQIVTSAGDFFARDKTARLWDAATGQQLAVLRGHDDRVVDAQFSPDGKYIVTASVDGTARIYAVRIEDLVALAKTRVTRELTCDERVLYLHEDVVCPTPTPEATPIP